VVSDDRLLTADQVAEMLAVPVSWVREHSRGGHLPCVRLGRYVRYERERVLDYIATQRKGGEPWRKHSPASESGEPA
jgi:excisionase family DNA binding protein